MSLVDQEMVADFRENALSMIRGYLNGAKLTDDFITMQLKAAEQEIVTKLKVNLEPTVIFPYPPTDTEIAGLNGKPWKDEPGYDYDPMFFRAEKWGYIITRARPIISVEYVRFAYPSPEHTVYAIPNDWLRLDRKYGHIRMVPASSTFVAPLGAFLMQALAGGSNIPSMIQVKYTAGLKGKDDDLWPLILDTLYKMAQLRVVKGSFKPKSGSISADGLSQSFGIDTKQWADETNEALFGPKGANGGLWTAIHGIGNGIIGTVP